MLIAKWVRLDDKNAAPHGGICQWVDVDPSREIAVAEHESALGLGPAITGILKSFRAK